jgi:hypothetical protein
LEINDFPLFPTLGRFNSHFTCSFYVHRSQKRKYDSQVMGHSALLGFIRIKASSKHDGEIVRPLVNFINFFCMKVLRTAFFYLHVTKEKLPKRLLYQKGSSNMLMKLTTCCILWWRHNPVSIRNVISNTFFFKLNKSYFRKISLWKWITLVNLERVDHAYVSATLVLYIYVPIVKVNWTPFKLSSLTAASSKPNPFCKMHILTHPQTHLLRGKNDRKRSGLKEEVLEWFETF